MAARMLRLFCVLWLVAPVAVYAVSFDCNKFNTGVYQIICSSGKLSRLDDQLSAQYQRIRAKHGNPPELKEMVRVAFMFRDTCTTEECLVTWYEVYIELYNQIEQGTSIKAASQVIEDMVLRYAQENMAYLEPVDADRKISPTRENISHYCDMTVKVMVASAADAASTNRRRIPLIYSPEVDIELYKKILDIDRAAYLRMQQNMPPSIVQAMQEDWRTAQYVLEKSLLQECLASPRDVIFFYDKIFRH